MSNVVSEVAALTRPLVVFAAGRGKSGKTRVCLYLHHEMEARGLPVVLLDADRSKPALVKYFPKGVVLKPPSRSDNAMRGWLGEELTKAVRGGSSAIVDVAGGDRFLSNVAGDVDLEGFAKDIGAELVLLYMLSGDPDDLVGLEEMEEKGLLAPERTAMVFNVGAVPAAVEPADAFSMYAESDAVVRAKKRGALFVTLPECKAMSLLDRKRDPLTFARGVRELPPWDAQQVVSFLRRAGEPGAFGPVLEWLS